MENQQPEALILANDRPSSTGDDLYQWALDAEDMIRRLHARVEELEAFAKEIEQYGILLRAGGAEQHDLKDRGAILEQYVKFNPRILEMDQQPETIKIASKLELAVNCGFIGSAEQYDHLLLSAVSHLRRLHARVEEIEKDRGNAKRLVSKIWNQHPEARDTIEKATGAWLVFGQDVETDGVSAQRVTQAKDHIAQPLEMVAAPVVLPEPVAVIENGSLKWKIQTGEYSIDVELIRGLHNLYTEQQVRELLATGGQPQTDARDAELVAAVVYASTEAMNSSMESPSFDGTIILESHHAASLSLALDELEQHRAAIAAAKEMK